MPCNAKGASVFRGYPQGMGCPIEGHIGDIDECITIWKKITPAQCPPHIVIANIIQSYIIPIINSTPR